MKLNFILRQFSWKNLFLFLMIIPLTGLISTASLAAPEDSFDSPRNVISEVTSKNGPAVIINRSDKSLFVGNKTQPEWQSFQDNAPSYVGVSVCGDGVCGEGESVANCSNDCLTYPAHVGCGDGICSNSSFFIPISPSICTKNVQRVCGRGDGWMGAAQGAVIGIAAGCTIGGPIGCGVGGIFGAITGLFITRAEHCSDVNTPVCKDEVMVTVGEVYKVNPYQDSAHSQFECRADCAAPAGTGCGVCGFDVNNRLCPNYCSNGDYNEINCVFQPARQIDTTTGSQAALVFNNNKTLKNYFTAAEVFASSELPSLPFLDDGRKEYYIDEARYVCNYGGDTSNLCPAGYVCRQSGGLKPGTALTAKTLESVGNVVNNDTQSPCPAGYFCPVGSSYPRPCRADTYSTGGKAVCEKCPAGTSTQGTIINSSIYRCFPVKIANDGVCNLAGSGNEISENPINSPYDCPDYNSLHHLDWNHDGRCTGVETRDRIQINYSPDCSCGDGICNNSETYQSCLPDCGCLDDICGTTQTINGVKTIFKEGNTCKISDNGYKENPSDCKKLGRYDSCGDGICSTGNGVVGEGYNNELGRIVCPLDCHCGDNICNFGEFYSSSAASGSCNMDCKCGDGVCQSNWPFYENSSYCQSDCHCGNNKCDYGETSTDCPNDCKCGDNICSPGESCPVDCNNYCNRNNKCEQDLGERKGQCSDCKLMPMPLW